MGPNDAQNLGETQLYLICAVAGQQAEAQPAIRQFGSIYFNFRSLKGCKGGTKLPRFTVAGIYLDMLYQVEYSSIRYLIKSAKCQSSYFFTKATKIAIQDCGFCDNFL